MTASVTAAAPVLSTAPGAIPIDLAGTAVLLLGLALVLGWLAVLLR